MMNEPMLSRHDSETYSKQHPVSKTLTRWPYCVVDKCIHSKSTSSSLFFISYLPSVLLTLSSAQEI